MAIGKKIKGFKSFNYSHERAKMEKEFEQIATVCRAEGVSEEMIELIHRIMLDELNSNRRFYNHTLSYDSLKFPDDKNTGIDNNPLLEDHLEQFCAPQVEICM